MRKKKKKHILYNCYWLPASVVVMYLFPITQVFVNHFMPILYCHRLLAYLKMYLQQIKPCYLSHSLHLS